MTRASLDHILAAVADGNDAAAKEAAALRSSFFVNAVEAGRERRAVRRAVVVGLTVVALELAAGLGLALWWLVHK